MQVQEKSGWSLQQHWDRGKSAATELTALFISPENEGVTKKLPGCWWIHDHVQCILELQLNLYIPQERKRENDTVKSTLPNKIERSMGLLHYYKCQQTIRSQFIYAKCFTELEWNLQLLTGDLLKYNLLHHLWYLYSKILLLILDL